MRFFVVLMGVLGWGLLSLQAVAPSPTNPESPILSLINDYRLKEGLPALREDPAVRSVAREWATTLAREGGLRHRRDLRDHMKRHGWSVVNENTFHANPEFSPALVLERWTNSPRHRANLLRRDITLAGIGYAKSTTGGHYVVFNGAAPEQP
jgi:uncharacterized protein YkwD